MKKTLHVFRELVANTLMRFPIVRELRLRRPRTVSDDIAVQVGVTIQQMSFFFDALQDHRMGGKSVAEIGPGDAIPLALLLHALGVERYVAVDRYKGNISGQHARSLYAGIAKASPDYWGKEVCENIRDMVDSGEFPDRMIRSGKIAFSESPVEDISTVGTFDCVLSFNVLEHCSDIPCALNNIARALTDEGFMIHRVDYTAHDVWRSYENPLEFLTFSDWLWRMMGSNRGYPNRLRHSQVLDAIAAAGFHGDVRVSHSDNSNSIKDIRDRLADRFRSVSDSDLSISDAVFVLNKRLPLPVATPKPTLIADRATPKA